MDREKIQKEPSHFQPYWVFVNYFSWIGECPMIEVINYLHWQNQTSDKWQRMGFLLEHFLISAINAAIGIYSNK